jgi:hypothetical protein
METDNADATASLETNILTNISDFLSGVLTWIVDPASTSHAIITSAIFAGLFTCIAMILNRKSSKEKATIDIIHTTAWDHDFISTRNVFKGLRESNDGLVSCAGQKDSENFAHVLKMLNHYELIAVGIDAGILSDKIYGKYYRTRFVCDWFAAKSFIEELRRHSRNNNKTKLGAVIYVEFERLATRWAKKHKIDPE